MDAMIMVAQLLLSLSILVAVHEMGHLLAAKYFGMRVEQFSIGFPPKIWSFTKGETEYALSAIPLGGYVKISGMIDESLDTEALKQEPQHWEFRAKPAWQRLIVMLGGIFVNVIVGVLIFIGLTYAYGDKYLLKDAVNNNGGVQVGELGQRIGLQTGDKIIKVNGKDFNYFEELIRPQTLLTENASYTVLRDGKEIVISLPDNLIQDLSKKDNAGEFIFYRYEPIVERVSKGSIADRIGLKKGDKTIEVNGTPIRFIDELQQLVRSTESQTIDLKIERDGKIISFEDQSFPTDKKELGIAHEVPVDFIESSSQTITYSFFESIPLGTERAFATLVVQVKAFGKVISGVLSPKESLSGPIGIAKAFGSDWDWQRFWTLTGVLSLVLAFMNLLPIPALDGGHVMFLSYEMISRRKPSDKFLEGAQKVGMIFLLALMVFIFANDIIKLFN